MYPQSERAQALDRATYDETCEEILDYWAGGLAQRSLLQQEMIRRLGEVRDPRQASTEKNQSAETSAGRLIREGRLELWTVPFLRAIAEALGVLYAADDLERIYSRPGGSPDATTATTIAAYHEQAKLSPRLHQLDAMLVSLRTVLLLVRWCPDLGRITYDLIPPHWAWVTTHPSFPLEPRLAYAIAYAEGGRSGSTVWSAYVRPALPGDPADAPTRLPGFETSGRFVRYTRDGAPWGADGQPPAPGAANILPGGDRPNPLVSIGGMEAGRRLWSPLVWHWAELPFEGLFLLPADDLARTNLELDVGLSTLAYVANLQSYGQPVRRGGGSKITALGPSTLIEIDDANGAFEFVTPDAPLDSHRQTIRELLQIQAMLRHLAPDSYSITRPSISTGPAKLLEQTALVEARWRRTLLADSWEADRFELERLLHNAYGASAGRGPVIPDDVHQVVRWGELRVPVDRAAQVRRLVQEITAKISSRTDAVMEVYGLTREDAERKIADDDRGEQPEATDPAATGADGSGAPPEVMQNAVPPDSALNGAQVASLLEIVGQVAAGKLPRDSALEIIVAAYPVDRATADRILGTVGRGFKAEPAAPPAVAPSAPPFPPKQQAPAAPGEPAPQEA